MIEYKKAVDANDLIVDCREDQVMLAHRESPEGGILCLALAEFDEMTETQVMERFNVYIDSLLDDIANDRPIEIAHGNPQLKWNKACQQWTTTGGVLRCVVAWDSNGNGEDGLGELAISIDDKLLTGDEFLAMIESYEGWGMRIEFMHPNRLINPPKPIVQTKGR